MNLLETLHDRWADCTALNDALPSTSALTGNAPAPTLPFATLRQSDGKPIMHANDGSGIDRATIQVNLYHQNYNAGLAIVQEIREAFHRWEQTSSGDLETVLDMRRVGESHTQQEDGTWLFSLTFEVDVYLAQGA